MAFVFIWKKEKPTLFFPCWAHWRFVSKRGCFYLVSKISLTPTAAGAWGWIPFAIIEDRKVDKRFLTSVVKTWLLTFWIFIKLLRAKSAKFRVPRKNRNFRCLVSALFRFRKRKCVFQIFSVPKKGSVNKCVKPIEFFRKFRKRYGVILRIFLFIFD
jgi:hypothetical protein